VSLLFLSLAFLFSWKKQLKRCHHLAMQRSNGAGRKSMAVAYMMTYFWVACGVLFCVVLSPCALVVVFLVLFTALFN
jgi:hypothetical protein